MDNPLYWRTAINLAATCVYIAFLTFSIKKLRSLNHKIDRFMQATILMMGLSILLADYVDIAFLTGLPVSFGPFYIANIIDIYYPLFIGILIDIARLTLIVIALKNP